jgi:hypothetical protein
MTLSELPNRDNIMRGARQYFRSVRDEYRFQNTPAGPVKRNQKNLRNNRHNRRKRVSSHFECEVSEPALTEFALQKANDLRRQIPAFRDAYGDEQTVGLEQVILTDYMSSEHSDPGVVPVEEYKKYQCQHGGGSTGLEIRKEEWRSTWVCK